MYNLNIQNLFIYTYTLIINKYIICMPYDL